MLEQHTIAGDHSKFGEISPDTKQRLENIDLQVLTRLSLRLEGEITGLRHTIDRFKTEFVDPAPNNDLLLQTYNELEADLAFQIEMHAVISGITSNRAESKIDLADVVN